MMSSHSKDNYYLRRADFNKGFLPDEANAALFIYLNKTGFNGIYRVNRDNKFNVPVGSKLEPFELDYDNLRAVSSALQSVSIRSQPFSDVQIAFRDFIYLDPPYHETYAGYSKTPFGEQDHEMLAEFCRNADKSGAYFMQSNSDTPFIRNLYEGYNIEIISAKRSISRNKEGRHKYDELIIRNY
jgi:DNA adenine methylase